MRVKHKQTTSYAVIGTVLLAILLFIPIPQQVSLKAVITASTQFQVITDGNGGFSVTLKDLWQNQVLSTKGLIPERGTFVEYQSNPEVSPGVVTSGDTLGWFYSSRLMEKLVNLEGNIKTLRATLEFERSGSRASVIEAARQQLTYAKTRLEEQQKILERSRSLLEGNIITQQEYELDVRKERLETVRVSIAEANLGAALSGAQTSKLEVYRTQIADEERKLQVLRDVLAEMTIVSPVNGKLHFPAVGDTLLTVYEVDDVIAVLPMENSIKSMVKWSTDLDLGGSDYDVAVNPDQIHFDEHIYRVGREQLILVQIRIDNAEGQFIPGQLLEASMRYIPQSIFQMIKEMF